LTAGIPVDAGPLDGAAARDLTQICDYIEEHDTSITARAGDGNRTHVRCLGLLNALASLLPVKPDSVQNSRFYLHPPALSNGVAKVAHLRGLFKGLSGCNTASYDFLHRPQDEADVRIPLSCTDKTYGC
jgi:hypothetical protein